MQMCLVSLNRVLGIAFKGYPKNLIAHPYIFNRRNLLAILTGIFTRSIVMLKNLVLSNSVHSIGKIRGPALIVLATLSLAVAGGVGAADGPTSMSSQAKKDGSSTNSPDKHSSMMNGMKDMKSMQMSGDADRDFAMKMKHHHEGALHMANVELKDGKDATLRRMATSIIEAQKKEIAELDHWLAQHKEPMHNPTTAPASPGSHDSHTMVSSPR